MRWGGVEWTGRRRGLYCTSTLIRTMLCGKKERLFKFEFLLPFVSYADVLMVIKVNSLWCFHSFRFLFQHFFLAFIVLYAFLRFFLIVLMNISFLSALQPAGEYMRLLNVILRVLGRRTKCLDDIIIIFTSLKWSWRAFKLWTCKKLKVTVRRTYAHYDYKKSPEQLIWSPII